MSKPTRAALAFVLLALLPALAAAQDETVLKHDDDTQESKRSITGAGHAVRFECPDGEKWYVTGVALHGSRYGMPQPPREDFLVCVTSDDMKKAVKIKKPYSLFERGEEKWVPIEIPPVEVQGAFQVVVFFNPTRTKGVYVGIDENSSPTHSTTVVPSDPESSPSELKGDWMIRALVTKTPKGRPRTLLDAHAQAEKQHEDEAAADARLLGSARSLTLSDVAGEMDEHINIQGAVYTVEFQTPKDVEAYVWQVQMYGSQFGGQHDSEAVNGDVYILDANRKILSRTSFPYSLFTQQKQWVSIPTLPTRVQGKFYIGIDTHGGEYKGIYIGYKKGNAAGKASAAEIQDEAIQPADWSSRFAEMQWMIRAKVADRPVVYGAP